MLGFFKKFLSLLRISFQVIYKESLIIWMENLQNHAEDITKDSITLIIVGKTH